MMLIVFCAFGNDFTPRPKTLRDNGGTFRVAKLSLTCDYVGSSECPKTIQESFEFYSKLAFSRDEPYSVDEYQEKYGNAPTISLVSIKVLRDEEFELKIDSEGYKINVKNGIIVLEAQTPFAVAKALASLVFLPDMSEEQKEDRKYYSMSNIEIDDQPQHAFRAYTLDGAGKFVKIEAIKRTIDAISIQKLNVLLFKCGGVEHLPFRFKSEKAAQLISGSFSPYHYYEMEDLSELQRYAESRGVIIVPEIVMPGGAGPFRKVNQNFVADCPLVAKLNHYSIALNPLDSSIIQIVASAYRELANAFFPADVKYRPILHFSGEMPSIDCWKADEQISKHAKQKMMNLEQLHYQFYERLFAELSSEEWISIVNEDLLLMDNSLLPRNVIVDFTKTRSKNAANGKELRQIESTGYGLHEMHPNGGYHYFYEDTWMDMRMSPSQGSSTGLGIGGCIEMPAANCWDESCMEHAFDRGIGVAEMFWSGSMGDARRLQNTGCKIYKAVGYSGPLDIGEPCVGY